MNQPQPSSPLAFNLSQCQGLFQRVGFSHHVAKENPMNTMKRREPLAIILFYFFSYYFINVISSCCSQSLSCLTLQPQGLEPDWLLCPWDFPGKKTKVRCHFFLWGTFLTWGLNPCLLWPLRWQADSVPLRHLRSPINVISVMKTILFYFFYFFIWLLQSYTEPISFMKKGTLAVTLKMYPQGLEQWHKSALIKNLLIIKI